jgi:hypothetical protein
MLAHDTHEPLALFEQLDGGDQLTPDQQPAADEQTHPPAPVQAYEQQQQRHGSGRDPLEMLSLLAAISPTPS